MDFLLLKWEKKVYIGDERFFNTAEEAYYYVVDMLRFRKKVISDRNTASNKSDYER